MGVEYVFGGFYYCLKWGVGDQIGYLVQIGGVVDFGDQNCIGIVCKGVGIVFVLFCVQIVYLYDVCLVVVIGQQCCCQQIVCRYFF